MTAIQKTVVTIALTMLRAAYIGAFGVITVVATQDFGGWALAWGGLAILVGPAIQTAAEMAGV